MIKSQVKACIERCVAAGCSQGFWPDAAAGAYVVEVPKREGQGDFSTNFALVSAGKMKVKPRDIATKLASLLADEPMFSKVEIAGPGFVNLFVHSSAWATECLAEPDDPSGPSAQQAPCRQECILSAMFSDLCRDHRRLRT